MFPRIRSRVFFPDVPVTFRDVQWLVIGLVISIILILGVLYK